LKAAVKRRLVSAKASAYAGAGVNFRHIVRCIAQACYQIHGVTAKKLAFRRFPRQLKQAVPAPWKCCSSDKLGVFLWELYDAGISFS
jgi:arginine/lysine/ornithine decarboxylase